MPLPHTKVATFAVLTLTLGACAYTGGDISNPLVRKSNWFAFIDSQDIKKSCAIGSPDMYRIVYNGVWDNQVRIYQLDGLRKVLKSTASRDADINSILQDGLNSPQSQTQLIASQYQDLEQSFAESGLFGPAPVGLDLPSRSYYWVATYCKDGKFGINAWKYPSAGFDRLTFPARLLQYDATGVSFAQAGPVPLDLQWEERARKGQATEFRLKITKDGIVR